MREPDIVTNSADLAELRRLAEFPVCTNPNCKNHLCQTTQGLRACLDLIEVQAVELDIARAKITGMEGASKLYHRVMRRVDAKLTGRAATIRRLLAELSDAEEIIIGIYALRRPCPVCHAEYRVSDGIDGECQWCAAKRLAAELAAELAEKNHAFGVLNELCKAWSRAFNEAERRAGLDGLAVVPDSAFPLHDKIDAMASRENDLTKAAEALEPVFSLRNVKAIGLREVPAVCRQVAEELAAARAIVERFRATVEKIEWSGRSNFSPMATIQCPWCHRPRNDSHRENCLVLKLVTIAKQVAREAAEA